MTNNPKITNQKLQNTAGPARRACVPNLVTWSLRCLCYFAVVIWCFPSNAEEPSDEESLTGTWKITVFLDDGRDRLSRLGAGPSKKGGKPRVAKLVFNNSECYVIRGDGKREVVAGLANAAWKSFQVDNSASPNTIDILGFAGKDGKKTKTYLGIYKLDGDKLTNCYSEQGKTRPTKLESDGAMNLFECTRVAKEPMPLPR